MFRLGARGGPLGAWPASQAHVPSPTQCRVDMPKGKKKSKQTEEWGNMFGCCDDPVGCCYVYACHCCALCDIGNTMGDFKVGPKKETASSFMDWRGQVDNCCSYNTACCCFPVCLAASNCEEKCWCYYDGNILAAYAKYANKKTKSPGPCDDAVMSMCIARPLILCLMYRELKLSPGKKVVYGAAPPSHEMSRV